MSAPDSSLEIERKYAVERGFVLPDLSAVPGVAAVTDPRAYHLTAVYHDTPGLRLAAAHITLRRHRRRVASQAPGRGRRPPRGARTAWAGPRGGARRAGRPGGALDRRRAAAPHRPA